MPAGCLIRQHPSRAFHVSTAPTPDQISRAVKLAAECKTRTSWSGNRTFAGCLATTQSQSPGGGSQVTSVGCALALSTCTELGRRPWLANTCSGVSAGTPGNTGSPSVSRTIPARANMECVKADLEEQAEHLGPAGNCGHTFSDPNRAASLDERRPRAHLAFCDYDRRACRQPRRWRSLQCERAETC